MAHIALTGRVIYLAAFPRAALRLPGAIIGSSLREEMVVEEFGVYPENGLLVGF